MENNNKSKLKEFFSTVFYVLKELLLVGILSKYEDLKTKGWRFGLNWGIGVIPMSFLSIILDKNTFKQILIMYLILGMLCGTILTIRGILKLRDKK